MDTRRRQIRLVAAGVAMVGTTFGLARYDAAGLSAAFVFGGAAIALAALVPPREELRAVAAARS
jgi:hypothetical protein